MLNFKTSVMKKKKYIQSNTLLISILAVLLALSSCNEEDFLKEIPKDFYAPEISYVKFSDFDAAVLNIQSFYQE